MPQLTGFSSVTVNVADLIPRHLSLSLPVPEVHTDDYDRILRMLKMHTEPTIELTEEAAMHLVDDQWGWSKSFASNTSSYLVQ
jgi:hypothetical protein